MPADDDDHQRLERAVLRLEAQARCRAAAEDWDDDDEGAREWDAFLADHPELTEGEDDRV